MSSSPGRIVNVLAGEIHSKLEICFREQALPATASDTAATPPSAPVSVSCPSARPGEWSLLDPCGCLMAVDPVSL